MVHNLVVPQLFAFQTWEPVLSVKPDLLPSKTKAVLFSPNSFSYRGSYFKLGGVRVRRFCGFVTGVGCVSLEVSFGV